MSQDQFLCKDRYFIFHEGSYKASTDIWGRGVLCDLENLGTVTLRTLPRFWSLQGGAGRHVFLECVPEVCLSAPNSPTTLKRNTSNSNEGKDMSLSKRKKGSCWKG